LFSLGKIRHGLGASNGLIVGIIIVVFGWHFIGQIKKLFQGKIQSYIKCIKVKYESVSEESFFDISLNLKDCADIYASLDDYVREEILEGDNEYDTGVREFKKQEAKKGVKLL